MRVKLRFEPKISKFKNRQKGKSFKRVKNIIFFNKINIKLIRLVSLSTNRITSKQLKSFRMVLKKKLKKKDKIEIKIFPHFQITKKPIEVRMGKGKGHLDHWVFNLKYGFIMCEIKTKQKILAIKTLKAAQLKLPIKTKIIFI